QQVPRVFSPREDPVFATEVVVPPDVARIRRGVVAKFVNNLASQGINPHLCLPWKVVKVELTRSRRCTVPCRIHAVGIRVDTYSRSACRCGRPGEDADGVCSTGRLEGRKSGSNV